MKVIRNLAFTAVWLHGLYWYVRLWLVTGEADAWFLEWPEVREDEEIA
jgi:hypothetical protein